MRTLTCFYRAHDDGKWLTGCNEILSEKSDHDLCHYCGRLVAFQKKDLDAAVRQLYEEAEQVIKDQFGRRIPTLFAYREPDTEKIVFHTFLDAESVKEFIEVMVTAKEDINDSA